MLVTTDAGSSNIDDGEVFRVIGGAGISTAMINNVLTITNTADEGSAVFQTQLDFGEFVPDIQNHAQFMQLAIDIDYGTITTPAFFGSNIGTIV